MRVVPSSGSVWTNNTGASNWSKNRGSLLVHLLPYVEQQPLYDAFDMRFPLAYQQFTTPPANQPPYIAGTIVSTYKCPSDTTAARNDLTVNGIGAGNLATFSYAGSKGSTGTGNNPNGQCPERAVWMTYRQKGATDAYPSGPFTRRGRNYVARIRDVPDGTSNTIFMGEVRGDCAIPIMRGWAHASNVQGMISTIYPINYNSCNRNQSDGPCHWWANWSTEFGFKSEHPTGAMFAFGDGSVHFVTETIDHWTYQYLGGRAEGKPATLP